MGSAPGLGNVPMKHQDSAMLRRFGGAAGRVVLLMLASGGALASGDDGDRVGPAAVVIAVAGPLPARIDWEVRLAPAAGKRQICGVVIDPAEPEQADSPAAAGIVFSRDDEGCVLDVRCRVATGLGGGRTSGKGNTKWGEPGGEGVSYTFWPPGRATVARERLGADSIEPRTWHERWIPVRLDTYPDFARLWVEGLFVRDLPRQRPDACTVALHLAAGDRVRRITERPLPPDPLFMPIDITPLANARFAEPMAWHAESAGPPFLPAADGRGHFDLVLACWVDQQRDPATFRAEYDDGPYFLHDPRMPFVRVPKADYVAAHLIAAAADDEALTDAFTLRAGRYDMKGQVVHYDFAGRAPRHGAVTVAAARSAAGPLARVVVPMGEAFAQDIVGEFIEIELTKEVRLARHQPDPNRFNHRPLGPASGVRIVGLTLEKSPLQMRVTSPEHGHVFEEPAVPTFTVQLHNISDVARDWRLRLVATPLDAPPLEVERGGSVAAGDHLDLVIPVPVGRRGYHDLRVELADTAGRPLLGRSTSFAVLAPDTRRHRDSAPFGCWDFGAQHFSNGNPDVVGPLHRKLGMRYGMGTYSAEDRRPYGLLPEKEMKADPRRKRRPGADAGIVGRYQEALDKDPDTLPRIMVFHETAISGGHVSRVPDLFHDRPPYRLDEAERARFEELFGFATAVGRAIHERLPGVRVSVGNGNLHLLEELFRHGLPADCFDAAGTEPGSYGRLPEAQPPDFTGNNASFWMARRLLDAHGYAATPIEQCYEICYPGTNPGNLDPRTQAAYYVRHALHSLAWKSPLVRPGLLHDVGSSYRFSNWGSSGFLRTHPELNPKPSYVAVAVLTRMLDGAVFERVVPLGSASLYALEFRRPDGDVVTCLWTLRGRRDVTLSFPNAQQRLLVDGQGNETDLPPGASSTVTLSPAPVFLVAPEPVQAATAGAPLHAAAPPGSARTVATFASLADWETEEGRDPLLDYYNHTVYRRRGDFAVEPTPEFEGRRDVLRVEPRPVAGGKDTMPMYQALVHRRGLPLPGTPTEIGLWINGNSGWGRVIFELQDAGGQTWTSIGAARTGEIHPWMLDWMPPDVLADFRATNISDWNTNDVFGVSAIAFDGWRYVGFPLPGNYPGEGHPWPANSQWRHDADGRVRHPLTLKRLIVELPEKVLHVQDWAAVERPAIYLADLVVAEGDAAGVKTSVGEWEPCGPGRGPRGEGGEP